ncbi:MAG TPA: molybdate ABC transporter substrate-binding protein, partial [Gemmataceae bacterium]|nr:molybdate ABC transporter substrate-binding protein [Gemmataceae bacterium]
MSTSPPPAERPPGRGEGWGVGLRVWVERAGRAVLGEGRLELLEGIRRHHSISAAARQMGMSYRRAWTMVQDINAAAGEALVVAATGGVQGGGAQLTPIGFWAITVFRDLQGQLRGAAVGMLGRLCDDQSSARVHVAAAVSLDEVLGQLLTDYALRDPAARVRAVFGASDELADQLLAGAPFDLFLTADPGHLDRLEAAGLVERGRRVPLAGNGLAAVAAAGRDLAVRGPADLAGPDAPRVALAEPPCPLGAYTRAYLDRLGLPAPLPGRSVRVENSRAVIAAVRAGQADVGLAYASDAARAEGCRTLFRVRRPPLPIRYCGAVLSRAHDADAAGR